MEDCLDVEPHIDAADQWPDEIAAMRPLLLASALDERTKWGKPCRHDAIPRRLHRDGQELRAR